MSQEYFSIYLRVFLSQKNNFEILKTIKLYFMKTKLINLFAIALISIGSFSCKGEKKNETVASEAQETSETPKEASIYIVNDALSTIEWTGIKPTGKHTGTIKVAKGKIALNDDVIQSGSFMIDMTSITVTDLQGKEKAGLEGHLKGEAKGEEDHFFNVTKFPSASFEVTGISKKENKTFMNGNLTIKGIKKNISFPVSTAINGNTMTLNTEVFTINRTDWGINYASKSIITDIGDKFINDDIELKISVTATKA